jgi:hypothetical protein
MRYLLLIPLTLWTLALVAIGAGPITRLHPTPHLTKLPHLCAGWPCVEQVAVGQTRWGDAINLTNTQPITRRFIEIGMGEGNTARFYPSIDAVHVGRGYMHTATPAGYVLLWYGEPCAISYYPASRLLVMRYPHTLVNIQLGQANFTPRTPINMFTWQDPAYQSEMQPDICVDNITDGVVNTPWRGFTSYAP